MRSPSHPALRCGIQEYRQRSSRAPTRDPENTGKFTREILFPGPRIAVRADTVLDVVSRIYPRFIPKENSRQYRPGHWGARPVHPESPFSFPAKEKGSQKKAPIGRTGLRASVIPNGNSVFKRYPRCSTHKQHLSGPRIMCGVTPLVMRSDAVSINIWGESYCCYSSYVMNWSPHRVQGDTKEAPPFALLSFF